MKTLCPHKNLYKNICFTVALFIIAQIENDTNAHQQENGYKTVVHPYNGMELRNKKELMTDLAA